MVRYTETDRREALEKYAKAAGERKQYYTLRSKTNDPTDRAFYDKRYKAAGKRWKKWGTRLAKINAALG